MADQLTTTTDKNNRDMKEAQIRFIVLQEKMNAKLDTIIELLTSPIKKPEQIPTISSKLDDMN